MQVRFGTEVEYTSQKYVGVSDPNRSYCIVKKDMEFDTEEGMDA
jgi:hypothetical protein